MYTAAIMWLWRINNESDVVSQINRFIQTRLAVIGEKKQRTRQRDKENAIGVHMPRKIIDSDGEVS